MLGKSRLLLPPAGCYVDQEGAEKRMVWKLGKGFLRMEGTEWSGTFDAW